MALIIRVAFLALLAFASSVSIAQEQYPARSVTIIVPLAAGSGTDIMARELADGLSRKLNRSFVVENRPGANGITATEFVARAANDGYTLMMGGNTTHSANPHLSQTLKYDAVRDFSPIARLATAGAVLVNSPKSNISSVTDLVREAKASPEKFSYGAANAGAQIAGETINKNAGIKILRVPYRSTPQAMTDVIGGSLALTFVDVAAALTNVKGGQVRALAITTAVRSPLIPDVPTLRELGFDGFDLTYWNGLFGPANLPTIVVATLDKAVSEVMAEKQMLDRLSSLGLDSAHLPQSQMDAYVRGELARWGTMIKDAGIEPN